jgi:hypothetical protein
MIAIKSSVTAKILNSFSSQFQMKIRKLVFRRKDHVPHKRMDGGNEKETFLSEMECTSSASDFLLLPMCWDESEISTLPDNNKNVRNKRVKKKNYSKIWNLSRLSSKKSP